MKLKLAVLAVVIGTALVGCGDSNYQSSYDYDTGSVNPETKYTSSYSDSDIDSEYKESSSTYAPLELTPEELEVLEAITEEQKQLESIQGVQPETYQSLQPTYEIEQDIYRQEIQSKRDEITDKKNEILTESQQVNWGSY